MSAELLIARQPSPDVAAARAKARLVRDRQRVLAIRRRKRLEAALPWLIIIAFVALWELFVRALGLAEFVLPTPSVVVRSMIKWYEPLLINAGVAVFILGYLWRRSRARHGLRRSTDWADLDTLPMERH